MIYLTACELYKAAELDRVRLRLMGVRVENLGPADQAPRQLALGEPETGWREAERAMDQVSRRFGSGPVRPVALVRRADDGNSRDRGGERRQGDDRQTVRAWPFAFVRLSRLVFWAYHR
jgi:hypothetical protein